MTYNVRPEVLQLLRKIYFLFGREYIPAHGLYFEKEFDICGIGGLPWDYPKWVTEERHFTDLFIKEVIESE